MARGVQLKSISKNRCMQDKCTRTHTQRNENLNQYGYEFVRVENLKLKLAIRIWCTIGNVANVAFFNIQDRAYLRLDTGFKAALTQRRQQRTGIHAKSQKCMEIINELRKRRSPDHLLEIALGALPGLAQHTRDNLLALIAQKIGGRTANTCKWISKTNMSY